jgi:transcriptional regulator with XRE-family HTH domain
MPLIKLKELRQQRGIRQGELAKLLMVKQGTVSKWENLEREPDFETLNTIANYFGVSIDYLMGREDETLPNDELLTFKIAKLVTTKGTGKEQRFILDFLELPPEEKEALETVLSVIKKSPSKDED